jgi:hippurate hydrolase
MNLLSPAQEAQFVALRRDIHAHPELAFEERRTAALVAQQLRSWGYAVHEGLGGTGVVGQLVRGHGGARLGLRADMDALPIEEASGVDWSSQHVGTMHACGHDGHTAMLLAAAHALAERGDWVGTLNLIFQPAEEGGGGALRMMADGLFERFPCDAIFAAHNMPGVAAGDLVFRSGAAMASSDYATVTVHGKGGHGAMPHLSTDPLVAAASMVMALQTVVSRNVDPLAPAVVTVGALHAGQADNVIPASATLKMSVRALDPAARALIQTRVLALLQGQADSYGVGLNVAWRSGYAVLVNDERWTRFACGVAQTTFGVERVNPAGPMLMGSEDFAFMLQRLPGCYFLIGNGADQTPGACMVHNPGYDFNDDILSTGATFWVRLAEAFFNNHNEETFP